MTSDEEFAACEKSDRYLRLVVGRDGHQTSRRLIVFIGILCALFISAAVAGAI